MTMLKFVLLRLWRAPRFSLMVLLSLAMGLLGVAMVGTVIESVLLRALPFPNSEQLYAINEENAHGSRIAVTQQNARDLEQERQNLGISRLAVYNLASSTVTHGALSFIADAGMVGSEFFRTLAVTPMIGRDFPSASELDQNPNVALISEQLWRSRLGGESAVIGQVLNVFGHSVQVIGVIPQAQVFPEGADVWLPDRIEALNTSRSGHNFQLVARLAADAQPAVVQQKLNALAARWKASYGTSMTTEVFPMRSLRDALTGSHAQVLWSAAAAACFLLLIAGMNASNVWLARILGQRQEFATELSLGLSPALMARGLWLQSLVLCLLALLLAMVISAFVLQFAQPLLQSSLPRADGISLSANTLAALLLLCVLLSGLCVALPLKCLPGADERSAVGRRNRATPAPSGMAQSLAQDLAQNSRTMSESTYQRRVRSVLSASQTAVTVVLLFACLLLAQSVHSLLRVNPGFRIDGIASADVSLSMELAAGVAWGGAELPDGLARYQRALESIAQQPGVEAVALTSGLPLSGGGSNGGFLKESSNTPPLVAGDIAGLIQRYDTATAEQRGSGEFRVVSRDYFRVLDIPLLAGRGFLDSDTMTRQHVAVVSESLAKTAFPGIDPLGQRIQFGGMDGDVRTLLIVGVVADIRGFALDAAPEATVYVHLLQRPRHARYATFVARGALPVDTLSTLLTQELQAQADLPSTASSLASVRDRSLGLRLPLLVSFSGFVLIAIVLAALGVYGLARYHVVQRAPELFVRYAVGASLMQLARQQLQQSLTLHLAAIVLGLLASTFAARLLVNQLFDVSASDPLTLILTGGLMLATCTGMASLAIAAGQRQLRLG